MAISSTNPTVLVTIAALSTALTLTLCIRPVTRAVEAGSDATHSSTVSRPPPFVETRLHARAMAMVQQANVAKEAATNHEYPLFAVALLEDAADSGYADAQYELGRYFGRHANYQKSTIWLEAAAYRGVAEAQHLLCLSHVLGRGVPKDPVRAYAWCELAQRLGSTEAEETLTTLKPMMNAERMALATTLSTALARDLP